MFVFPFALIAEESARALFGSCFDITLIVYRALPSIISMRNPVKDLGFYEKRLCLLLFLSSIPDAFETLQVLTLQFKPNFICSLSAPRINQLNSTNSSAIVDNCYINSSSASYVNYTNSRMEKCTKFEFDGPESSIISDFSIVCDKAWIDPVLVSLYMAGKIFGHVFGGYLSDRFGRRPTFLLFVTWQFGSALVLSFTNSVEMYGLGLLLAGSGSSISYAAATFLGTESVHPKYRSLMYFVVGSGYAVGFMLVAAVSFWIRDWRWFLRFYFGVGLMFIPYFWLIDETPKWLAAKGRTEDLKQLRKKVAKMNDKAENEVDLHTALLDQEKVAVPVSTLWTLVAICKRCKMLFRLLAVCFAWWSCSVSYYAITFNIPNLSGNRFLNIFFGGLVEVVSMPVYYFLAEYWGRRTTYCTLMAFNALSLAAIPLVTLASTAAVVVLAMTSKFSSGICFSIIYIYTGELFPTKVRHSVFGVANVMSKVGGVVAPFIVYAGESGYTIIPFVSLAGTLLTSSIACYFLPETKNVELPQTISEAVQMKRQSLWTRGRKKQKRVQSVEDHSTPQIM